MISNMSRRGFLLSLLGAAATGALITCPDLLAAAPSEDRYTDIVRRARDIVTNFNAHPEFRNVKGVGRIFVNNPHEAIEEHEQKISELWQILSGMVDDARDNKVEKCWTKLVIPEAEVRSVCNGGPNLEWGMLDDEALRKVVDRLIPIAVYYELEKRGALNLGSHYRFNHHRTYLFEHTVGVDIETDGSKWPLSLYYFVMRLLAAKPVTIV
jgi:hypothetical protein